VMSRLRGEPVKHTPVRIGDFFVTRVLLVFLRVFATLLKTNIEGRPLSAAGSHVLPLVCCLLGKPTLVARRSADYTVFRAYLPVGP